MRFRHRLIRTAGQLYGGGGWGLSPRVVIGSRATKIIFASPGDGRSVTVRHLHRQ